MTCATGCFDPAPEYSEPTRVPPVIYADQCHPPPTLLYPPVSDARFDIAFRADDVGLNLKAWLFRDIGTVPNPPLVAESSIPSDPRAFADQQEPLRTATVTWQWTLDAERNFGCHTITAVITDLNNFKGINGETNDALAEARITWFVWIKDQSKPAPAVDCFSSKQSGVPQ
jgi:hypothetical protein